MGMIGNYVAIEEVQLQEIITGKIDILTLEPRQYLTLDIDKTWQAIHYLLCNDIDEGQLPMGYVVPLLFDNVVNCKLDFGAFYLSACQVKVACDYLDTLNDEKIASMYDFSAMLEAEVYPLWNSTDAEEFYEYIYQNLMALKEYYQLVAKQQKAIIFYII